MSPAGNTILAKNDCTVSGCLSEAGISPTRVGKTIMVCRTYPIRVQNPAGGTSGPMRQELDWEEIARRAEVPVTEIKTNERTSTTNRERRTDQEQDTVSGGWSTNLFDFPFREYRPAHGRWTSPDPAGLGSVDPTNPQSWNRYAYVLNNPLAMVDPLGLEGEDYEGFDWGFGGYGGYVGFSPNGANGANGADAANGTIVVNVWAKTPPGTCDPQQPSCQSLINSLQPLPSHPTGQQGGGGSGGGQGTTQQPQQPQQPQKPQKPQNPKSPARQQCEANAEKNYQNTFDGLDKNFYKKAYKNGLKGALWGGAIGCAVTWAIGCGEGGLPGIAIGGLAGAGKSMWDDLYDVGGAYLQYRNDMKACEAIP